MNRGQNPTGGSPTAALLLGVSFFAVASYWPQVMGGTPDAADDLYTGFFKLMGGVAMLGGFGGYYKAWQQREKRKASEQTSGTFGEAAFATLEECEHAGLLDPKGCISACSMASPSSTRARRICCLSRPRVRAKESAS